jgi:hypothetical protein
MKTKYEAYKVGSEVWAISRYSDKDGNPTDHCAIYQARVQTVYIQLDEKTNSIETEYWLETPSGDDWGCEVKGSEVSDSFDELVTKLRSEWIRNSNTF